MTNYIKAILNDYCVLDLETTGLSPYYDSILEVGILRVRNNEIVDRYSQLVNPEEFISPFVTELTGISNEMVIGMPTFDMIKGKIISFLGDDVILGHNTSFDIRFLSVACDSDIKNKYMDTIQFSKKVYPDLEHYTLSDMTSYLGISTNEHRALADCISTKQLYDAVKSTMSERGVGIEDLWAGRRTYKSHICISKIVPNVVQIDEDGFFYDKHVVFTGKLEKMTREQAMQLVVDIGGKLESKVSKKTDFLILGDNTYNAILHGEKSSKHKAAEALMLEGYDIKILDEQTFYDIINDMSLNDAAETNCEDLKKSIDESSVWVRRVRSMLETLEMELELPKDSLWLSDNKSQKNQNQIISYSVCIWEPSYPAINESKGMNRIVMTITPSTASNRPEDIDLSIRNSQVENLSRFLPEDAILLDRTKSDLDTETQRIRFNKSASTLIDYVRVNVEYCVDRYESKAARFGCCSRFIECSDRKKCVHENRLYSKACSYRENLEKGQIFYGKNRNID